MYAKTPGRACAPAPVEAMAEAVELEGVVSIPLVGKRGSGFYALVDAEDAELVRGLVWHAQFRPNGCVYAGHAYQDGDQVRTIRMHRFILNLGPGDPQVDHRDCNGLNNRRANLRVASSSENSCNRRIRADNRSGYKGVSWHKGKRKWVAEIAVGEKREWLGAFEDPAAAARAYDDAARRLHGEFARVNFGGDPCKTP